jgi:hypothetical protein
MKKFSIWMILWIILFIINCYLLILNLRKFNELKPTYDSFKKYGYDLSIPDMAPDANITFPEAPENSSSSTRDVTVAYVKYSSLNLMIIKHLLTAFFILVILFILYKNAPPK